MCYATFALGFLTWAGLACLFFIVFCYIFVKCKGPFTP